MPLIALEGVRYRYPEADRQALDGITAAVEPGQVILLRGPSGSGKSTLLRCLNGLVPHSTGGDFAGRVTVCGLDIRMRSSCSRTSKPSWPSDSKTSAWTGP